jgi:hypothetical protein
MSGFQGYCCYCQNTIDLEKGETIHVKYIACPDMPSLLKFWHQECWKLSHDGNVAMELEVNCIVCLQKKVASKFSNKTQICDYCWTLWQNGPTTNKRKTHVQQKKKRRRTRMHL